MLGEFYFISLLVHALSANVLEKEISAVKNPSALKDVNPTSKDLTHYGREGFKFNDSVKDNTLSKPSELNISTSTPVDIAPQYDTYGEKNDGKPIVAKKGAVYNLSDFAVTSIKIPLTTKAVITHINVEENETQTLEPNRVSLKNDTAKLNIPLQSHYTEKEIKIGSRSNIVLPVIAVILSVPLVGILIVVFYKRGAEWWQHRHYRRMDFLIDGMYNN
ncbi:hypothetical protein WA026_009927 [Henosepilachna vigintioctopunctata]|uniref:Uncharacterized protein n=1 Tax=Henosepilachna vigintioctopunctata TaxID=420089 RepID=A0AAW1TT56_9CUCU